MDPTTQALFSIDGHHERRKREILQEMIDQYSEPGE
jgi:hypothetical protein